MSTDAKHLTFLLLGALSLVLVGLCYLLVSHAYHCQVQAVPFESEATSLNLLPESLENVRHKL